MEGVEKMSGLGQAIYEDGMQAGKQAGKQAGVQETLVGLVQDGILQITEAARRAQMSEADFYKILEKSK